MSVKKENLVSIIIPVYNRKHFVVETLNSLLHQSYKNWEAIVVDDGSTDGTIEILNEFHRSDSRFKIFKRNRQPKGAQTCRNIGLEKSKGDYIIFLDSDDLLANYCLEYRKIYMEGNPELDFAVFPILIFDKEPGDSLKLWNTFTEENDLDRFIRYDVVWQTSSPIYKRDFIRELRWDEKLISGQDWDFHLGILALTPEFQKVDTIPDCFIRRDHSDRISYRFFDPPEILNRAISLQKNHDLLKQKNLWKKKYDKPFIVIYYLLLKELVKSRDCEVDVINFFRPLRKNKLIKIKDYYIILLYLLGLKKYRNNLEKRNLIRKYFSRFLPKYLNLQIFNVTQEKVELKGKSLQDFLEKIAQQKKSISIKE